MRQVNPWEVDPRRSSPENDSRRHIAIPRQGPRISSPRGTSKDPGKGNRTHLPGSDDATRPSLYDRGSLRRDNTSPRGRFEGGSDRAGGEGARVDGHSGEPSQALSTRVQRGDASADHDCEVARDEPEAPDCGLDHAVPRPNL